ncbi:hypothetical protein SH611_22400 [Geminicoccaceae bacterium 1502E]|nr:hypothetical protein [Geminicoccaceae bacterium 1502E]
MAKIAAPMLGCKNHVGNDRGHGFVRRLEITAAAAPPDAVPDPADTASPVGADTACRPVENIAMPESRGLKPRFQRSRPQGKPMPRDLARGNARRARIRTCVEHVLAAYKWRFALVIRTLGKAGAAAKPALANLACNLTRFLWLEARQAA